MPRAESLVGYKRVARGDLVINIMIAWNGSLGVSGFNGVVSPAYCVYRFLPGIHAWYFHHLLRTPAYLAWIKAESTGVIDSRLRLYSDDLGRIELLVPTHAEQVAITQYINNATHSIDVAVERAQREIDLIREYRTRLIADVVTGKLDVRHLAPPPASADADELSGLDTDTDFGDELPDEDAAELVEGLADADE